ncbi:cytochrome P450 [Ramaria rubella]|nr:cytochrome P450 [Ramaria rubella]
MSSPSASPGGFVSPPSHLLGISVEPTLGYAWAGFAVLVGIVLYTSTRPKHPYASIPAVGRTGIISSYIDAIRFIKTNAPILEGYNKYKPGAFRVPKMNHWQVIVCGEKLIDELRKAPDTILSFHDAANENLATEYTMGRDVTSDPYHVEVTRTHLTRNLAQLYPAMREELVPAFEENIPVTDDWTSVTVLEAAMKIVSRVSNRIFVGAPTCRDKEYIDLNIEFTINVIVAAHIIGFFPKFLKPLVARWCTKVPRAIRTGLKHLGPIIEERQQKIDEYGFDYPDRPNDFLSWLMLEAKGAQRTARNLTLRILGMNFAAIHTSSMTFTHALLSLASHPEYIAPIRTEIETVVANNGWNKVAMTQMRKLDSFLKESQRMDGIAGITLSRKALKDFTFSDGTRIPKGGFVSTVASAIHRDEALYTDPDTFNGFRFSDIREEEGEGTKNQMVATSTEYLPFGHGRHACPGRFFAANELKAMMAHLLLTYDIKLENGVRPESQWFTFSCVPDPNAKVLFRKRVHG